MEKYPLEVKLSAVKEYLNGVESIRVIAQKYSVNKTMLHRWIAKYQTHGKDALHKSYTNNSLEFKMDVLNYINDTGASIEEATTVYNVSSAGLVWKWKHLYDTQGIDALNPKIKERSPMKKETKKKKKQPVEESKVTLQDEVDRLRMENAYLKKLQALIQKKRK